MACNIHIDFETYSALDLKQVGVWVYSRHPSTAVICMYWAVDDEEPVKWLPEYPFPTRLKNLLMDGTNVISAWNSFFEWCIWHHTLHWDALPLKQWHDVMVDAAVHNLPLGLDKCGAALKLAEDEVKSKRGKYLINKLCKPQNGYRLYDNVLLQELYEYCKQDVIAERTISKKMHPIEGAERDLWMLDQKINIRGTYIDKDSCDAAMEILEQAKRNLSLETFQKTGWVLSSTNSRKKVFEYMDSVHGYQMDAYTKNDIKKALRDPKLSAAGKAVLEIRQREGKSSTAKYKKLQLITADDHRAHGLLQFNGASTGRWSGRMFQPHNLPRPDPALQYITNDIIEAFKYRSVSFLEICFGEPMEVMSTALRGMIIAPPDKWLYVGDYKQIEARALVWLAQQLNTLEVFTKGEDVYRHTAAVIYRIPVEDVTDAQRFVGKIATLALGYQGGYRAFISMAEDYGVDDMDPEFAENIKVDWRQANPWIVTYWSALETAVRQAISHPGKYITVDAGLKNIQYVMGKHWLQCILPSGRSLYYFHAMTTGDYTIEYWGTNSFTHQWCRLNLYGGLLAQNICEGVCRDLLGLSMTLIEDNGFNMILTVHDENIAEAEHGRLAEFADIMECQPAWSHGLPVAVDAFCARRYRK